MASQLMLFLKVVNLTKGGKQKLLIVVPLLKYFEWGSTKVVCNEEVFSFAERKVLIE